MGMAHPDRPAQDLTSIHIVHCQNRTSLVLEHEESEPSDFARFLVPGHVDVHHLSEPMETSDVRSCWEDGRRDSVEAEGEYRERNGGVRDGEPDKEADVLSLSRFAFASVCPITMRSLWLWKGQRHAENTIGMNRGGSWPGRAQILVDFAEDEACWADQPFSPITKATNGDLLRENSNDISLCQIVGQAPNEDVRRVCFGVSWAFEEKLAS